MSKIVIDTNILYSWIGFSVNSKLTQEQIESLSSSHDIYCTTPTIVEAIIKHRDDTTILKQCLKPIIEGRLKIISIGFLPVSSATLVELYSSGDSSQPSHIIDELLQVKVLKEAQMLRFVLYCILAGMFNVFREKQNYYFGDVNKDSLFAYSSHIILVANSEFVLDTFIDALQKGYADGSPDKSVNDAFETLIRTLLNVWIVNYHLVKHSLLLHDFKNPDPELLRKCMDDYRSIDT